MSFLDNLARSVEKTANSLGHQAGQFIDGHASGGFLVSHFDYATIHDTGWNSGQP